MIDLAAFAQGMGVLAERFRSPMDPNAQKGYYAILSEELTTEEFRIAIRLAFRHSQFWPSPQQLIEFSKPQLNIEGEAVATFEKIRDMGEHHPSGMIWRRDKVAEIGAPALAGFDAIGANEGLRNMQASSLHFLRRSFVEAYKAKANQTQAELEIENARKAIAPPSRERERIPGPQNPEKSGPAHISDVIGART